MNLSLLTALTAAVCLGQVVHSADGPHYRALPSDAHEYAATAKTVEGDVSVLRDLELWAIVAGDQIRAKETVITGLDGHALFEIADGSSFEVFPNSRVVFRNNPPNWKDLLDVWLGKVRVKIEHLTGKPNPHRVLTPTAVISVRGTTFDISVDGDETTYVEVEEGSVGVEHALLPSGTAELGPGESIRIYRNEPIARNRVDKGGLARRILNAVMDAVVVAGRPHVGGGGGIPGAGGGGGTTVGDTAPPDGPPSTGPGELPPATGPGALPPPPSSGPGALPLVP